MPKKPSILIVEDEHVLAHALKEKLSSIGLHTKVAYDGEEAIRAIKAKQPDMILLDILLPKLNGIEFLLKIKKKKDWKDIPVIILSNYSAEDVISQANKIGVVDYLIKSDTSLAKITGLIKKILKH